MTKKAFTAEISEVLNLMINSLYTNKDIFLRELISNASDACDKVRYLSNTSSEIVKDSSELKITIESDKEKKLLFVQDNGIGMNKDELENNLGTIAHSGTKQFLQHLSEDSKKDNKFIGQFGVGFYSAYMVANMVEIITKKLGENQAYKWFSEGKEEYTIEETEADFNHGTKIILHMKKEEGEFLDQFRIKHIVKSYSDHILVPIYFVEKDKEPIQINSASALWIQKKNEITKEKYTEFYRNVGMMADEPWLILHNTNEGMVSFSSLLFIPSKKTFDLFHPDRKRRVKLYIQRVFITDKNVNIIPQYLRFLRGVVDAEDLPLNISRETLQHNIIIERIKSTITKKVLSELKKKKQEALQEYKNFWQNFGTVLKEGLCEHNTLSDNLLDICIFYSAKLGKMIDLEEYIKNIPENAKTIYYLSGEDVGQLKNSPQIEGLLSKGIDVLLFTDSVDDFWVTFVNKYKDYEFTSATRSNIDVDKLTDESKDSQKDEQYDRLINYFKGVLGENIKNVIISKKLTSSPVCLAIDKGSMDIRMEKFLIEQKQLKKGNAKILEINPNHHIVSTINQAIKEGTVNNDHANLINLLFDQACIIDGEPLKDVYDFVKKFNNIIEKVC